ncbi:MAG: septal ring lytic transglycosylase RlpA family protein [Nitrospirae bacterium YQR-1]
MKRAGILLSIVLCIVSMPFISAVSAEAKTFKASWYGKRHYGRKTASGQIFQKNKRTAAHKTLPFGAVVKVTNISNGESTEVVINDRGPRGRKKEIDLSYLAAKDIGLIRMGIAHVKLEVALFDGTYINLAALTKKHVLAFVDTNREIIADDDILDDTVAATQKPEHETEVVETGKMAVD